MSGGQQPSEDHDYPPAAVGWWAVVVFLILYIVSFVDRQMLNLLVDPIRASLDISDFEISLLQGFSFAVFYALFGLPLGWLVDRMSRRHVVFWGLCVWAVCTSLCGLASRFWHLGLARIGVGAGEAALAPAAYSMLSDLFPKHRLALPMSVMGLGAGLGIALAGVIGGFIISVVPGEGMLLPLVGNLAPWQLALVLTGLPGILLAPLVFTLRDNRRRPAVTGTPAPSPRQALAFIAAHKRFYFGHFLGFGLISLTGYGLYAWLPTYLIRHFGYAAADAGIAVGTLALVGNAPGAIAMGFIVDRWYRAGVRDAHMRIYMIGTIASALAIAAAMGMDNARLCLAIVIVQQLFTGFTGIAASSLQIYTPPPLRGQISAIYLLVMSLVGLGLGPSVVAALTQFVFQDDGAVGIALATTFAITAPPTLLCFWLAAKAMRDAAAAEALRGGSEEISLPADPAARTSAATIGS